jgi:hypothetical protein
VVADFETFDLGADFLDDADAFVAEGDGPGAAAEAGRGPFEHHLEVV